MKIFVHLSDVKALIALQFWRGLWTGQSEMQEGNKDVNNNLQNFDTSPNAKLNSLFRKGTAYSTCQLFLNTPLPPSLPPLSQKGLQGKKNYARIHCHC